MTTTDNRNLDEKLLYSILFLAQQFLVECEAETRKPVYKPKPPSEVLFSQLVSEILFNIKLWTREDLSFFLRKTFASIILDFISQNIDSFYFRSAFPFQNLLLIIHESLPLIENESVADVFVLRSSWLKIVLRLLEKQCGPQDILLLSQLSSDVSSKFNAADVLDILVQLCDYHRGSFLNNLLQLNIPWIFLTELKYFLSETLSVFFSSFAF